jgi:hypothetical protein
MEDQIKNELEATYQKFRESIFDDAKRMTDDLVSVDWQTRASCRGLTWGCIDLNRFDDLDNYGSDLLRGIVIFKFQVLKNKLHNKCSPPVDSIYLNEIIHEQNLIKVCYKLRLSHVPFFAEIERNISEIIRSVPENPTLAKELVWKQQNYIKDFKKNNTWGYGCVQVVKFIKSRKIELSILDKTIDALLANESFRKHVAFPSLCRELKDKGMYIED